MKKSIVIDKVLKDELDAFLYQYSTSKPETIYKAIEVVEYARDILTDTRTEADITFDLTMIDKTDTKGIELLQAELKLSRFMDILDNFITAGLSNVEERIPQKQLQLYIDTI